MRVYDQAVLLKGLNNKKTNLLELLDELQCLNIESYYLCHCVPMASIGSLSYKCRQRVNTYYSGGE